MRERERERGREREGEGEGEGEGESARQRERERATVASFLVVVCGLGFLTVVQCRVSGWGPAAEGSIDEVS